MESINHLASHLQKNGLEVTSVLAIDYGNQIRLECGVIINAYRTGKVLVQGKLDARGKAQRVHLLQHLLPAGTKFPPSMVPQVDAKPLVRHRDGYYVDANNPCHENYDGRTVEWEPPTRHNVSATRLLGSSVKPKDVGPLNQNLLEC